MATATRKKKTTSRKAPPSGKGLTYEKVWAALQETDRILKEQALERKENAERFEREMKENAERFDREMKENAERFDREMKENAERFEREMKEKAEQDKRDKREMEESAKRLDKQLGKLGNRFGEMVEYMVMPNLVKKFRKLGYVFTKAYPHADISDSENNIFVEIDITLENGDKVMIVEVKSKPSTEDITEHIERMKKVRRHADLHGDKRIFLGAVAGMVFNKNEKIFAMKNGFYVIEPSGDTFNITVPEGEYSPKEW